jgi:cytosolic carboxypeptidase protein 2/3
VFISARVHPGETNSSWMAKGAIDFLLSQAPEAHLLREKMVFKVVPMLNPDGVINGNYRCSLSGADLNRRWKTSSKILFPEIFETKRLVKTFQKERQIVLYCDIHGHSRNKNVFIYGNNYPENPESTRLFPFIMSKVCDSFSFESSRFVVHPSKDATARVTMWKELKIPAVYTMEASFCGPDIGAHAGLHYTAENLMDIGRRLCLSLLIFCDVDIPKGIRELNAQGGKKRKPGATSSA